MNSTSYTLTDKEINKQWMAAIEDTDIHQHGLSEEFLAVVKHFYTKGLEDGQIYTANSMQEIFYNDPCLFEEYFEELEKSEKV